MNTFIIISAILLVIGIFPSETNADAKTNKIVKECLAEGGIAEEEFKKQKTLNYDDPKVKCLLTCIKTKYGLIVDGKIPIEKLKENLSKKKDVDNATKETIVACAEQANQQTGCDVGATIFKCVHEKIQKGKIPTGEKGEGGVE